jgi:hypothetical protein
MDPYAEQDAPPPRSHKGCLWGCLGTLIAAVVVIAAVFTYGAWYLYKGFADDPRIQTIAAAVRANDEAVGVLGHDIKVMAVERQTYDFSTGKGGSASYTLKMVGSNGEAEVNAELDVTRKDATIKSLVLIDSEGHSHYLVGGPPANPMMIQNSI